MPTFDDANGVTWLIRTTSTQINTGSPTTKFVAAVDDTSTRDYSGNQFPLSDEDTFPAGTVITWPANGNPILRGAGDGEAAIKAFAARENSKKAIAIVVKPDKDKDKAGTVPWWMVVLAFYAGYRVIKKQTSGRYVR
jgi:hypothetical protein